MEVRIGEMTFDYGLLLKRIVHIQSLVQHIKDVEFIEIRDRYEYDYNSIKDIINNRNIINKQ